jgi:hypothetical protein
MLVLDRRLGHRLWRKFSSLCLKSIDLFISKDMPRAQLIVSGAKELHI